jgi:hypothetical protein
MVKNTKKEDVIVEINPTINYLKTDLYQQYIPVLLRCEHSRSSVRFAIIAGFKKVKLSLMFTQSKHWGVRVLRIDYPVKRICGWAFAILFFGLR